MNDIIVNKIQSIQRCVERAREEYAKNPDGFDSDFTVQDAAIMNVVRACEQAIDLANHIIKWKKMGIPNSSAESFDLLQKKSVIERPLCERLKHVVCFRNIVVHQYEHIDVEIVKSVIRNDLNDLVLFTDAIMLFSRDGLASS
ncbi:MAG: toxin-antitoxin antitoxin component [Planctomycetes bacterium RBG_16_59_8]|nr:MAG: toxin-antitoxin antitoxin component [Planctomycetes bacterium RBG_16_59_8]